MYETQTKSIPIRSQVPNAFDFDIEVEANPRNAWAVTPLRGTVRGLSETAIQIDFTPVSRQPAQMKLIVNTSRFGSKPCICVVTGVGIAPEPTLTPDEDGDVAKAAEADKEREEEKGGEAAVMEAEKVERGRKKKPKKVVGVAVAERHSSPERGPKSGLDPFMQELKARRMEERRKELRRVVCLGEEYDAGDWQVSEAETNQTSLPPSTPDSTIHNTTTKPLLTTFRINAAKLLEGPTISVRSPDPAAHWSSKNRLRQLLCEAMWTVVYRVRAGRVLKALKESGGANSLRSSRTGRSSVAGNGGAAGSDADLDFIDKLQIRVGDVAVQKPFSLDLSPIAANQLEYMPKPLVKEMKLAPPPPAQPITNGAYRAIEDNTMPLSIPKRKWRMSTVSAEETPKPHITITIPTIPLDAYNTIVHGAVHNLTSDIRYTSPLQFQPSEIDHAKSLAFPETAPTIAELERIARSEREACLEMRCHVLGAGGVEEGSG
ncbi:hypothetical protein HDV00_007597 [Rhizophlyctis rosea]|nr:hypothetical protein HDV00_007597 [Rhizophlyctis rosea]